MVLCPNCGNSDIMFMKEVVYQDKNSKHFREEIKAKWFICNSDCCLTEFLIKSACLNDTNMEQFEAEP